MVFVLRVCVRCVCVIGMYGVHTPAPINTPAQACALSLGDILKTVMLNPSCPDEMEEVGQERALRASCPHYYSPDPPLK